MASRGTNYRLLYLLCRNAFSSNLYDIAASPLYVINAMILVLEIVSWLIIALIWGFIVIKILSDIVPRYYLTWFGGLIIILIFALHLVKILPSITSRNLGFLYSLSTILFWTAVGLIGWYLLLKFIPRAILTCIGFASSFCLFFISLYIRFIEKVYQIYDWNFVVLNLLLNKSLWQWLTEAIIPVTIPFSIALWGWWNQKQQTKISQQNRVEEYLKVYLEELLNLVSEMNIDFEKEEIIYKPHLDKYKSQIRMKTLLILERLEDFPQSKRKVMQYLIDLHLIKRLGLNLSEVNLSFTNLSELNLEGVNLSCSNMNFSNLDCSNLHKADLRGSRLNNCQFRGAKLTYANLERASLRRSDFSSSHNRRRTDLKGAVLQRADLTGANLGDAILSGVNLDNAKLSYANLLGRFLKKNLPFLARVFYGQ